MAFTPDEKARIKARAEELLATGLTAGEAAQQATSELFSQQELLERFSAPEPVDTRSADVRRLDVELSDAEADYRRERTRQLRQAGRSPDEIRNIVSQELQAYREPAPLGFGTPEERTQEDVGLRYSPMRLLAEGKEYIASRPQSRRIDRPIGEQQQPTGINYDVIGEQFAETFGTSQEEGLADAYAFRDLIVAPRLEEIRLQGGSGALVDDEVSAIEEGFTVLQDMYDRIQDKDRYIQAPEAGAERGNIWIRTFGRQVDPGEGVPDLTPEQMAFLNARESRRIQRLITERMSGRPTMMVIKDAQGRETGVFERGMRIDSLPEGSSVERRLMTREEVTAQIEEEQEGAVPWWMDPQKKVEVIANPQEYEDRGFLTTTTPYGTQREETLNFLIRGAMTFPNIVAGLGAGVAYGAGPIGEERARLREEKGFQPNLGGAIFQNVAENRGFFGEAQEAADIAGLTGLPRALTLGGGFAADILDPSLDAVKALGVVGTTGLRTRKALVQSGRIRELAEEGASIPARLRLEAQQLGRDIGTVTRPSLEAGARDFLDNYIAGSLIDKAAERAFGRTAVSGNPRTIAGRVLTDEYHAVLEIERGRQLGLDGNTIVNALEEADLQSTQAYRLLKREVERADNFDQAFESFSKVISRNNESIDDLRNLVNKFNKGQVTDIPRTELQRLIGTMARNDAEIAERLREVDELAEERGFGNAMRNQLYIYEMMANPRYRNIFLKAVAADRAMGDVFRATEKVGVMQDIVALTKNTYAGKQVAREILETASRSDIAKLGKELADETPFFINVNEQVLGTTGQTRVTTPTTRTTPTRTVAALSLTEKQAQTVRNVIEDLKRFNRLSDEVARPILQRLERSGGMQGFITTRDLRTLIDAEVDAIAAARAARDAGSVIRSTDVAKMPIIEQLDILEPIETRTFVKSTARRIYNKLTGRKIARGNLSLGQRQLLQRAQEELQNLDIKLRKDFNRMLKDPEFRALYEADDIQSRAQALAYLIVGPRNVDQLKYLKETKNIREVQIPAKIKEMDEHLKQYKVFNPEGGPDVPLNMEYVREMQAFMRRHLSDHFATQGQLFEQYGERFKELNRLIKEAEEAIASKDPDKFFEARIQLPQLKAEREEIIKLGDERLPTEDLFERYMPVNEILRNDEVYQKLKEEAVNLQDQVKSRKFPPESLTTRENLKTLLNGLIDNMYITDETVENVFDVFVGTSRTGNNSVLSMQGKNKLASYILEGKTKERFPGKPSERPYDEKSFEAHRQTAGQELYDSVLDDLVETIFMNPKLLWRELHNINSKMKRLIYENEIVQKGGKSTGDFRYDVRKVKPTFVDGKIPQEWQVSAYYRARAQEIAQDLLTDVMNKELRDTNLRIDNILTEEEILGMGYLYNRLGVAMTGKRPEADAFSLLSPIDNSNIIANRLRRMVQEDTTLYPFEGAERLTFNDIVEIFPEAKLTERMRELHDAFFDQPTGPRAVEEVLPTPSEFQKQVEDFVNDPRNFNILQPVLQAADDIARSIIRKNGFDNFTPSIDDMEKMIRNLKSGDTYDQLRLMYGDNVVDQLREGFESAFDTIRKDTIELINKRNATGAEQLKNVVKEIYTAFLNFRYLILLNLRPRFHGANLLTGADIYYKTTGRFPDFRNVYEGAHVFANKHPNKIIFTDQVGRSYTSDELNDILLKSTGKSVYGLDLPQAKARRLSNLIESGEVIGREIGEWFETFKDLPQYEDLLFRYAALKAALQEGRSLDDAIALAKRSMFDASNITDAEKQLKNLALFYGFQRQNLITAAENLLTARGRKRLVGAVRVQNNLNRMFTEKDTAEYSPSYTQTRIIFDRIGFDPDKGKDLIIASPPLASLEGVYALADFLKLQPQGFVGGSIRPEFKSLLGIEDKFDRDFTRVPPEHIYILEQLGYEPSDVINLIVGGLGGEEVIPVPVRDDEAIRESAYNGVIYPLSTPKQRAAYKRFFDAMSLAGVTTPITDYARTFGAEGTKVRTYEQQRGIPFLGRVLFGTAAGTPYVMMSPERQAYYDRLSRLRELQGVNAAIRAEENRRMRQEASPEAIEEQQEIQEARQTIQEARQVAPTRRQRTALEIAREIRMIQTQARTGQIDLETAYRRLEELQAEYEALPQ